MAFGGEPPTGVNETWNGTSWTEVNNLNTARRGISGVGASNTAVLAFGGEIPPATGATESWNGTSWTEENDLSTARFQLAGAGTQTSALAFGGFPPPSTTAATEEWTGAGSPTTKTITTS